MYRMIITLKSLILELKKLNKKFISFDDVKNTMTFQMASPESQTTISEIVSSIDKKKNYENDKVKQYTKKAA